MFTRHNSIGRETSGNHPIVYPLWVGLKNFGGRSAIFQFFGVLIHCEAICVSIGPTKSYATSTTDPYGRGSPCIEIITRTDCFDLDLYIEGFSFGPKRYG